MYIREAYRLLQKSIIFVETQDIELEDNAEVCFAAVCAPLTATPSECVLVYVCVGLSIVFRAYVSFDCFHALLVPPVLAW